MNEKSLVWHLENLKNTVQEFKENCLLDEDYEDAEGYAYIETLINDILSIVKSE